jgi:hypothetical protein
VAETTWRLTVSNARNTIAIETTARIGPAAWTCAAPMISGSESATTVAPTTRPTPGAHPVASSSVIGEARRSSAAMIGWAAP